MSIDSHVVFWIFSDLVITISGDLFEEVGDLQALESRGTIINKNLPRKDLLDINSPSSSGICCDQKFTLLQTDQGHFIGQADAAQLGKARFDQAALCSHPVSPIHVHRLDPTILYIPLLPFPFNLSAIGVQDTEKLLRVLCLVG